MVPSPRKVMRIGVAGTEKVLSAERDCPARMPVENRLYQAAQVSRRCGGWRTKTAPVYWLFLSVLFAKSALRNNDGLLFFARPSLNIEEIASHQSIFRLSFVFIKTVSYLWGCN